MLRSFPHDEQGQDMIEYTLLLAFIALTAGALLTNMKTSVRSIWTNASSRLASA